MSLSFCPNPKSHPAFISCFHRPLPKRGGDLKRAQIHSPFVQDGNLVADRLKLSERSNPFQFFFVLISEEAGCRQTRSCGETGPVFITCMGAITPAEISFAQATVHKTITGAVSRPIGDQVDLSTVLHSCDSSLLVQSIGSKLPLVTAGLRHT